MNYADLLLSDEWKTSRTQILKRDGYKCQNCLNAKFLSEFSKGILSGVYSVNSKPKEVKNTFIIDIWVQSESKLINKRSFINKSHRFSKGITCVAYFKEIEDQFNAITIALRKTSISNPIAPIHMDNFDEWDENKQIQFFEEEATTEIASENWESFDWMFVLGLHVHHKYYVAGKNPWEYPVDALVTLCWHCHEEQHKGAKIMECDEDGKFIRELTYCYRCHGAGVFPEFAHVEQGVCFRCHGARFEELIEEPTGD